VGLSSYRPPAPWAITGAFIAPLALNKGLPSMQTTDTLQETTTYQFSIDPAELKSAGTSAMSFKRFTSTALIEIKPPHLYCTIETVDQTIVATSKATLFDWHQEEPTQFLVPADLLRKIGIAWENGGRLTFAYRPAEDTLSWSQLNKDGSFNIEATSATARQVPTHVVNITLMATALQEAVGAAKLFVSRAGGEYRHQAGFALQAAAARGGFPLALIAYEFTAHTAIPSLSVAKHMISNVSSAIARFSGDVKVSVSPSVVYLASDNFEVSWKQTGFALPNFFARIFSNERLSSLTLAKVELVGAISLLSAGLEWVRLSTEIKDDLGRLILIGNKAHTKSARFTAKGQTPLTAWMPTAALPQLWPFSIKLTELIDVLVTMKSDYIELSACRGGLFVRSETSSHILTAYLHGTQQ
jgi:hypothetical protein